MKPTIDSVSTVSISDYKGTTFSKVYSDDNKIISAEVIHHQLKNKLEKGLIDQPLYDKAVEQLDNLSGDFVEVTFEKGGVGSGKHKLYLRGGSMGGNKEGHHPKHGKLQSEHESLDEAKDKAKRMNKQLSPGEKSYYKLKYHVVSEKEDSTSSKEKGRAEETHERGYPKGMFTEGQIAAMKQRDKGHSDFMASLKKDEDDLLEKGGEGSKGGKVIGHTKSGKAIYENANHSKHKDFTVEDHDEAIEAHQKPRDEYHRSSDFSDEGKAKNDHHYEQQKQHIAAKNGLVSKRENDQKKKQVDHHNRMADFHKTMLDHIKKYKEDKATSYGSQATQDHIQEAEHHHQKQLEHHNDQLATL